MTFYFPKKFRPWVILTTLVKAMIYLLKHWPLVLLLVLYFLPTAPHIMVSYQWRGEIFRKTTWNCRYIGLRGFIKANPEGRCPAMVMIRYQNKPFHFLH